MVDWTKLTHAYGSARDVPGWLEQIATGKAAAVDKLGNAIAHQGWASADVALAVTPLLVDLTRTSSGKVRAALLVLLADLACAGSHRHFLATRFEPSTSAMSMLLAPEMTALRAAVIAATHDAADFLDDKSAPVRGASALLMAVTGMPTEALEERTPREKNAEARADMLIALGWLNAGHALLDANATHESPIVRAAVHIARAYVAPIDATALSGLLEAIEQGEIKGMAWAGGDMVQLAVAAVQHDARVTAQADHLVAVFDAVEGWRRGELGAALVKQVFSREIAALPKRGTAPSPPLPDSLGVSQRSALELLSRYDDGWGGDQGFWLTRLGFLATPPGIQRYLGHPGPDERLLEKAVSWGGRGATLRQLVPEVCEDDAFESAVAAADAISAALAPHEAVPTLRLINRLEVPAYFTRFVLGLELLIAQGLAVAPALQAALESVALTGNPTYWTEEGHHAIDTHLVIQCAAALHVVDPATAIPRAAFDDAVRDTTDVILPNVPADWAARVRSAIDASR